MAIHYHQSFSKERGIRNFGDDINPYLLSQLFKRDIIDSQQICLIGIGTIINDRELSRVDHFEKKIVFSSGVGYGSLDLSRFDSSWDFACVRGENSARALNLSPDRAIADGAILISVLPGIPSTTRKRFRTTLIPHVESHMSSENGLRRICDYLGINYLSPTVNTELFISEVASSQTVITEAMHGAILADTLRVPWSPIKFRFHEQFKWEDWCKSVQLPHHVTDLGSVFWDNKNPPFYRAKKGWQIIKERTCKHSLNKILKNLEPMLSDNNVITDRIGSLLSCAEIINNEYS